MQPQELPNPFSDSFEAANVPTPSNVKVLNNSFSPLPSGKICALTVPEIEPEVVNCMNNTRWLSSSGKPLAEPLVTYHAPPNTLRWSIRISCPLMSEVELKTPIHGCPSLSTVPIATSDPCGALSIPIVTQLSYSKLGKIVKNALLIPSAVEPDAKSSL